MMSMEDLVGRVNDVISLISEDLKSMNCTTNESDHKEYSKRLCLIANLALDMDAVLSDNMRPKKLAINP